MTLDYKSPQSDGKPGEGKPGDGTLGFPDLSGRTVIQLIPSMQSGGAERGTVEVAAGIVEAGGTALVISAPGGRMIAELENAGARHIPLEVGKKSPLAVRANAKKVAAIAVQEKADLLHARSRIPAWVANKASQISGIPYLATWHGIHHGGALKQRYNKSLILGERVIAVSHFTGRHIAETYGVGEDRLRVIPRGVDLSRYRPENVAGGRIIKLSEQWKVPDGVPVVLMPGRLTELKGHRVLIDAVDRIRAEIGDWKFVVVIVGDDQGNSGYRASLEKEIEKRDLWNVMRMAPHCDDMAAAYKLADIVVVPSTSPEAFGRVPVEAQAMGAMVVAAGHGGLAETVIEGETGFLFTPGDAASLAKALQAALTIDLETRERLSSVASSRVHTEYDARLMVSRTLHVYEEILGAG